MPAMNPTPETNLTPETNDAAVPCLRAAYLRRLEEINAVPDSALVPINISIPTAVTTVLGSLPKIRAMRDQLAGMPGFDLEAFDKLEDYTLAVAHAQARYAIACAPPQSLPELSDRATALRARLHTDVMALAARGLISSEPLADLKGPNGYRNVSFDLESIAALLRDNWKDIEDKTAVTIDELDEAETLADQLLTEVGLRDHSTRATVESAAIRQRAYSLFFNTYDQVRRAISYIRWDTRDVDDIAPSLFLARATTRRRGEDEPTPEAPDTLASDRPESTQVEARASTRCSFAGSRPWAA